MKLSILILSGLIGLAINLNADILKIGDNGDFEEWSSGVPAKWVVNDVYKGAKYTKSANGQHSGNGALEVTTGSKQNFALKYSVNYSVQAGDKLRLAIWVKGNGSFNIGIYCYNSNQQWVGKNALSDTFKVDAPDWKMERYELTVPMIEHVKYGKIAAFCPVFTVLPDSQLVLDDFTIEQEKTTSGAVVAASPKAESGVPGEIVLLNASTGNNAPIQNIAKDSSVKLVLPKVIYGLPNQEMNLYFNNVVQVVNPGNYVFTVTAPKGRQDETRWRFTPAEKDIGDFMLTLSIYDQDNRKISEAETRVTISRLSNGVDKAITMLMVGDSLTDAAVYPALFLENMRKGGHNNLKLIGSHSGHGQAPVAGGLAVEGFGGWRWITFCQQWTKDGTYREKSNFIKKDGDKIIFDIQGYFDKYNNGKAPDVITFFLGVNDIAGAKADTLDAAVAESMKYMDLLINEFKKAAPNTLLGIALILPPSAYQDAFGANYGTRINRHQYRINQHRLLTEILKKYGDDTRVSIIPTFVNLDTVSGYPGENEAVFSGSKQTVSRQNNAVHPNSDGYRQIANTFYAWLKAQIK